MFLTAGPETSAPYPELGIIITTTYLGLLHGANDANTEVACLPYACAVPVLPATHTLFSGKPPNVAAAVPDVTTPFSAVLMYARVDLATGRWPVTCGLIFSSTLPLGLSRASPTRGLYRVPPLASATYASASCSGVTSM